MPGGDDLAQRLLVLTALGHWQAIEMGPDAAGQHVVAVNAQMVGGDGGGDILAAGPHELHRVGCRDVLQHDPEIGKPVHGGAEDPLQEHPLPVENVDIGGGHLTMNQQRHADLRHGGQHRVDLANIGDARLRIGGRPGRIELAGSQNARLEAPCDLLRIDGVGQIGRHQRLEITVRARRLPDARAIGIGSRSGRDRRHEIGHDDGALELARGVGRDQFEHLPVAQMQVPVIGAADDQGFGHTGSRWIALEEAWRTRL